MKTWNLPSDPDALIRVLDVDHSYIVEAPKWDLNEVIWEGKRCERLPYVPSRFIPIFARLNDEPQFRTIMINRTLYNKIQELCAYGDFVDKF